MTQTVNMSFEESSYLKLNNDNYLYELSNKISNILNISSPEIIYQDIEEDARYYNELNIISINIEFINNDYEIKKCIYHELRHKWYFDNLNKDSNDEDYINLKSLLKEGDDAFNYEILEIDAYAFMSKCLKEFDNIDYHHPNYIMDELIIRYKNKYLK